ASLQPPGRTPTPTVSRYRRRNSGYRSEQASQDPRRRGRLSGRPQEQRDQVRPGGQGTELGELPAVVCHLHLLGLHQGRGQEEHRLSVDGFLPLPGLLGQEAWKVLYQAEGRGPGNVRPRWWYAR